MGLNLEEVEKKAALLAFAAKRGTRPGAGYILLHSTGARPLGDDFRASLSAINKYLDDCLRDQAQSLGLKLKEAKPQAKQNLSELSGKEARAAQRTSAGYELHNHEGVVLDNASWEDVVRFLQDYAADIGADDIEIDTNKRKRIAPPTNAEMYDAANGHDNEKEIDALIERNNKEYIKRNPAEWTLPADPGAVARGKQANREFLEWRRQTRTSTFSRLDGFEVATMHQGEIRKAVKEADLNDRDFLPPEANSDPAPKASTAFKVESKRKPRVWKEEDKSELGILKRQITELWKQRPITPVRNIRLGHAFLRANELLPRGQFDPFVEGLGISRRSARGFMAEARGE